MPEPTKSIKVSLYIHEQLDSIAQRGESFSQVIERLLIIRYQIGCIIGMVEGSKSFEEWKKEKEGD